MDRDEDLPSDSDQSDADYNPEELKEAASEDESDDEPHLSGDEKPKSTPTLKTHTKIDEPKETTSEKEKSDALWADFLSDTDFPIKPSAGSSVSPTDSIPPGKEVITKPDLIRNEREHILVKPETIVNVKVIDLLPRPVKPQTFNITTVSKTKRPGGLSSVLAQIGKKAKLSTLEKTKLDWNSFKRTEGIDEQLTTHNKGKEGYLERQDFMQRTDIRQFEIEKRLRQTKRSNR